MSNQASERIHRLRDRIMETWEVRAIREVKAALPDNSLALRNSLPIFLDLIGTALNTTTDRTKIRIRWDREENLRIGKKHGRERARELDYTMDQLIFEYHILRQAICDVMEEEAPLSPIEREVIVCAVEQAVNDAATEFSETLRGIHEKFTYSLAHDLRGPITAAKMSADIMLKRPGDAEQCAVVGSRISKSMERLDLMIHDLLDGSRLRAGEELRLDREQCSLDLILSQMAEEVNFVHPNRLELSLPGPVAGFWNESGLRRVMDNLVGNALKFSPPESAIKVGVQVGDKEIAVAVHNEGTPISPEDQSILFQQFRRARTADGKAGWGLGLTVVKGITEALGGRVEVESSARAGTTFTVVLPADASPQN